MTALAERHCRRLEKGDPCLTADRARALLQELHGDWSLSGDGDAISRSFRFRNYYETIAFVNALALIAHREDHHPDLSVHYNRCVVRFSTHDVGGISVTDLDCARRADALLMPLR